MFNKLFKKPAKADYSELNRIKAESALSETVEALQGHYSNLDDTRQETCITDIIISLLSTHNKVDRDLIELNDCVTGFNIVIDKTNKVVKGGFVK